MTLDLFDDRPAPDVDWHPDWLPPDEADRLLARLVDEVAWRQDAIRTPRGLLPLPRLTAWQGEPDAVYVYSGIRNVPAAWTPAVRQLALAAEAVCGARFNSVLLNRYRSGADGMGWHADNEPELGAEPVIASVSLGATRVFDLRHTATGTTHAYRLTHGSLLVMRGRTQDDWRHRVAKEPGVQRERINLTFRWVTPRTGDARPPR
ncbi:alpha-ketoglutarate-dependent dioxygenase AlkB family protein [Burkholderia alba]|uniref:alpha-ketoglutarate-dependent dioxygenase AlkB family protein n=1 Tax=Burkholderia alba TaxID=2683677 RepID=UPI002B056207|nr:alpha-ketoglutarate-dependent dioxygenase AlkB [Burkholderia alba]